jgi:hypothetical protein
MELSVGAVHDRAGDMGPAAKYEAGPLDFILYPDKQHGGDHNKQDASSQLFSHDDDQPGGQGQGHKHDDEDGISDSEAWVSAREGHSAGPRTQEQESLQTRDKAQAQGYAHGTLPTRNSNTTKGPANLPEHHCNSTKSSANFQKTNSSATRVSTNQWFTGKPLIGVKICKTEAIYGNSNREKLSIQSNR